MNSGRYYLKIIKRQKKINVQTIIINILIKKRRYILFINKITNGGGAINCAKKGSLAG